MTTTLQPGKLVSLRGRDWIVLPSDDRDLLMIKPLGGSDEEVTGIFLPLDNRADTPCDATFLPPTAQDLGDISTARLLYESARLAFRNGAGPFRSLAKLSFRPRSYQMVPLIMALRQDAIRLLVADDVGVGKTIESLLIVRELLERRKIKRFAVVCLPHLCEQWQQEIRTKLDLDAVIIRSSTQARLDRQIQGDVSVYDYYPYQVISVDYIKAESRRDIFIEQCPELVIVDEAHTCARPAGASVSQQQRYHLLSRLAKKPEQQLILLTATPHSGKPEEFHSLLGLLKPEFEVIDIATSTQGQRRELARHLVQRRRADVERWLGEDTPFPERDPFEWAYDLSPKYAQFFDQIVEFARMLVTGRHQQTDEQIEESEESLEQKPGKNPGKSRVQYWTALGLLRGVMSSPAAGIEMLNTKLAESRPEAASSLSTSDWAGNNWEENPVHDTEFGYEGDNSPTQVVERVQWTKSERSTLQQFRTQLEQLAGAESDFKLASCELIISDWINEGYHPVLFCRYIATANYVGEQLKPLLRKKFPKLDLQVVTSELPDEVRRQRIDEIPSSGPRVLIATDCLSEGINLQDKFTAVLHYDLPWNPNRLEQREGRVDRFGQLAQKVKACLLFGRDNPIDGIVLEVLLRKVREIKRATGINVAFPEDSKSIIDTVTQALLLNPERRVKAKGEDRRQLAFDFSSLAEAAAIKANVTRKVDEAAEREKLSRSIFAQNAIKAQEIEADLKEMDQAIGDPQAVEEFVTRTLQGLFGVQVISDRKGHRIVTGNMPEQLRDLLPAGDPVRVSFVSPTPVGYYYLGRNHCFVEQLCQLIMGNTLARMDKRAARAAVIRTDQVTTKTTLLLFRCRNVIEQRKGKSQIVAEEMLLWGWSGTPTNKEFLEHEQAKDLLAIARASSELSVQARSSFLENELKLLNHLHAEFDHVAEKQAKRLVDAHERFSTLMDRERFQVVYPVLPMDLLGVYLLLPEGGSAVSDKPSADQSKADQSKPDQSKGGRN